MGPIERRYRNQIERRQGEVDQDSVKEHRLKDRAAILERGNRPADESDQNNQRYAADCDDEIRRHTRERDDDVAPLEIAVVARNDRNRLGAAEGYSGREIGQQRQQDRHERIDVRDRIPGQSAE